MKKETAKYKKLSILFTILSLIALLGPFFYFTIYGFATGVVTSKIVLGLTSISAIILSIVSILFKYHLRSPLFICLIGLWVALDNLLPAIIFISIAAILDEFIFSPLKKKYKQLYTINKEIDKR